MGTVRLHSDALAIQIIKRFDLFVVLIDKNDPLEGIVALREQKILFSFRCFGHRGQYIQLSFDSLFIGLCPCQALGNRHFQPCRFGYQRDVVRRDTLINAVRIEKLIGNKCRVNTQVDLGMLRHKTEFFLSPCDPACGIGSRRSD
jgi:hypothetical protein